MTAKQLLIIRLNLPSEKDIASLLDTATHMEEINTMAIKPDCSYCESRTVIRYGHQCRKQRFYCKSRAKLFVPTSHTIMSNSHFLADAWREAISDTVYGNAIDYTADKIGRSHKAVFHMRHKILMALQASKSTSIMPSFQRPIEMRMVLDSVLVITGTDYYHSNRNVREAGLLAI